VKAGLARPLLVLVVTGLDALLLALALGGWRPLANHPRALALLACWALSGVVLAALRPPRSRVAVAEERESRLLLAALGLIPLLIPPLAAASERFGWGALPGGDALRWSGVGLAALGLAVRVTAMRQLGSRFSPLLTVQPDHVLETRGLYAWIRHPGYLGAWLASLGAALAFGSGPALAPVLLFGALMAARARREEALLEEHFGEAWRRHRGRTGGFLPRPGRR
jgi:protein-S-isoprenylcysteine O-methyltransferase Ste14